MYLQSFSSRATDKHILASGTRGVFRVSLHVLPSPSVSLPYISSPCRPPSPRHFETVALFFCPSKTFTTHISMSCRSPNTHFNQCIDMRLFLLCWSDVVHVNCWKYEKWIDLYSWFQKWASSRENPVFGVCDQVRHKTGLHSDNS